MHLKLESILCEKPISITSDEIFELMQVQKETKKIVSEAFMVPSILNGMKQKS